MIVEFYGCFWFRTDHFDRVVLAPDPCAENIALFSRVLLLVHRARTGSI